MSNNNNFEEATTVHPMDSIVERTEKFETIRVIMEILCKELGISKESKPQDIFNAIHKVSVDHYAALDEFKSLRKAAEEKQHIES